MKLPARVGLITLACRDVERMAQLFRDLGWPETPESDEHHRTFQCTNGVVFGLYDAKHYEPHFGPPADGFRGFTLGVNLGSFEETQQVYETLKGIDGVELLEEPRRRFGAAASAGATRKGTSGTSRGRRARRSTSGAA
jgi:catechol 2,3-dioxygenase-like lactoylglutathione lyase family enzyme